MEVQIVGKEVLKPSSPSIKTFNLSFLDQQLADCAYIKLFFFYPNTCGSVSEEMIIEKTVSLKSSLSKALTLYYPLAGKTEDIYAVCTGEDDGAEFLEARVNGTLLEYLEEPNVDVFSPQLVPADFWELRTRPLLIIQASFFSCGGLAIGINISHRVADITTVACFVNTWASTVNPKLNKYMRPDFSGSLIFPPSNQFLGMEAIQYSTPNFTTRRFVFSASHIVDLQKKATKQGINPPTRVQSVTAFLWRIGMKMNMLKAGGVLKPSKLTMPISIRRILPLHVSDQTFGNLFELFTVHNDSGDIELSNLVSLLGEKIDEVRKIYQENFLQREIHFTGCLGSSVESIDLESKQDDSNDFAMSSWCKCPLYDADFGWGKPTWVATDFRGPNWFVLADTSDGTGIEVWVYFTEQDMVVFSSDEELLAYVTQNPSVL